MSARRRLPFGSGGDSNHAAAAPALAELRSELLVMPREELAEAHVDMMLFEAQLLATPRFAKTRAALPRPRRAAFVMLAVCGTLASCGLSAAGALPGPLQHITESIAHTLGVPQPHHNPTPQHSGAAGPKASTPAPTIARPAPTTVHHTATTTSGPKAKTKPAAHVTRHTPTPSIQNVQSTSPPIAKPGPTKPTKRFKPRKPTKPPSNNSSNTPAGYPDNWRRLATAAATAQLEKCAQADALSPAGCPQIATAADASSPVQSVQWSLVSASRSHAVVIARVHSGGPDKPGPATTVTVYEPFQMGGSYTQAGAPHPYRAYSGGVAAATMTWNGKSFTNVTFSSGSAAGHLPPGVTVPALQRPSGVGDSALLDVVQAGFADCVTATPDAAVPGPVCALGADPAGAPWTVAGDPAQGAAVVHNANRGDFTVSGAYSLTSASGASVSGRYAATLFFDGDNFQILAIAGS